MKHCLLMGVLMMLLTACTSLPSRFQAHPRFKSFGDNYPTKSDVKMLAKDGPRLLHQVSKKKPPLTSAEKTRLEDYFILCQKLGRLNATLRLKDLIFRDIKDEAMKAYYFRGKVHFKPKIVDLGGRSKPYTLYPVTLFHEMTHYANQVSGNDKEEGVFREEMEATFVEILVSFELFKILEHIDVATTGHPINRQTPYIGELYFSENLLVEEDIYRSFILNSMRKIEDFKSLFKRIYKQQLSDDAYLYALAEITIMVIVSEYGLGHLAHQKLSASKDRKYVVSTKELLKDADRILAERSLKECIKRYIDIWNQQTGIHIEDIGSSTLSIN